MAAAGATLLDIRHLTVRFGTSTVVDDVSFTIVAGEKFALVGESGSGKSITALSVLRLGKENLDAWWIIGSTFVVLVGTMLLLTFIGDALRDAFDTRKS